MGVTYGSNSYLYSKMTTMPRLPVKESTRDEARVVKAKLGLTWDELLQEAAARLDPDNDD